MPTYRLLLLLLLLLMMVVNTSMHGVVYRPTLVRTCRQDRSNKEWAPSEHYVRGPLQCRNWYAKITVILCQSNFQLLYDFIINPDSTHTHRPRV